MTMSQQYDPPTPPTSRGASEGMRRALNGNAAVMTTTHMRNLAVVTGASSGIGLELAKQFAEHDFDLIVAAEDDAIHTAAAKLATSARPFILPSTSFRDMVDRNRGRILFTSSIASTMPGAYQAVYNASKSFVQSFALALRNELKDTDVTVTSLMPGATDTELFERADMLDTKVGASDKDDPADVARDGFEALMAGDERVVSASLKTKLQGRGSRLLPDSAKAAMHRKLAEPGSGRS